jgi:hypothetical protein
MRWDAMGCDAMRCDAMRCDAMRCDVMRCDAYTHVSLACSVPFHVCVGFGWDYATMAIVDPFTKNVQSYAYDAFCTQDTDDTSISRRFCLTEGYYTFRVSEANPDIYTEFNGWSLCDISGSGSYEGSFKVEYDSSADSWSCYSVSADEIPTPEPTNDVTAMPSTPDEPTAAPSALPSAMPSAISSSPTKKPSPAPSQTFTASPTTAISFVFDVTQVDDSHMSEKRIYEPSEFPEILTYSFQNLRRTLMA